jgi:hypothetical protein
MNKKVNFVYEWIGPRGPITNTRVPNIIDLTEAAIETQFPEYPHDSVQAPHFYRRVPNRNIIPAYELKDEVFLYELNFATYYYRNTLNVFNINDGFLDNNKISRHIVNRIQNKKGYFLITVLFESYVNDNFFKAMTNYFTFKKIPLSQIVYATNCANGQSVYNDFCLRHNIPAEIKIAYIPTFRLDRTNVKDTIQKNILVEYKPGLRKKLFLNFNRRYSDHRLLFFMNVIKKNLLDKFYISMAADQPESHRSFIDNVHYLSQRMPNFNITAEEIQTANSVLPLVLDVDNFDFYPMEPTEVSVETFYENSLINIASETFFFDNFIHITEKTYKPIAFMQPFILVGAANSLQHIKDMGFKTFSKFWNEDYDLEIDNEKRMKMIFDIVDAISKWSDEEQIKFSQDVKETVEYNVRHLNTMPNREIEEFTEKYGA